MKSHDFSENYMVLRPEDISFFKIFCIFWDDEIEKKAYVDFPSGKEKNVRRRWFIFLSLLSQKILQSAMAKWMLGIGPKIEYWLNLIYCNRNIFVLFWNFLRGKVVKPIEGSETYLSVLGHLDKRVNLDENIKHGPNCRYYSALSAMASKISYENEAFIKNTVRNHWKMKFVGFYDFWNDFQRKRTTQAFILHDKTTDPDTIVVAFRGTEPFDADSWCTDVDISWYEVPGLMGKIHGGFMKALGLLMSKGWPQEIEQDKDRPIAYYTIREKLVELLKQNEKTKFIITGHSLGGALAALFPAILALHEDYKFLLERLEGVYTFGQPRVGDEEFKIFMQNLMQEYGFKHLRFVYSNDAVSRLPTDDTRFLFKHFGICLYYNCFYHGKIVEEEPNKNYIAVFAAIPRFLTAVWELIRGFTMPYTKGPDYREGWFLMLMRWYGLILPGLSAHTMFDYVNITRLGSEAIYREFQNQSERRLIIDVHKN